MRHHVDILAVGVLLFGFAIISTARRAAVVQVRRFDRVLVSRQVIRAMAEIPRNLTILHCTNR